MKAFRIWLLKRQVKRYRKALQAVLEQHKQVVGERDALAAHIERLREIHSHPFWGTADHWSQEEKAFSERPATSLAKRDAEINAEALELAAEAMAMAGHGPGVIKDLRDLAAGREDSNKLVDNAEAGDAGN